MTKQSGDDIEFVESPQQLSSPAVGIIATKENTDGVIRTAVRAESHGHDVLVTYFGSSRPQGVDLIEEMGAHVVEPAIENPDRESLQTALITSAQERGYPGILIQSITADRIDYSKTIEQSDTSYAVEATHKHNNQAGRNAAVGIPAYNEENTIASVVKAVRKEVDEVIVVDDGSEDETRSKAVEAGADVIDHKRNRGYGAALKTLFQAAADRNLSQLVVIDADGQHDPADISKLQSRLENSDSDIVIGSRLVNDGTTDAPFYRRVGMEVINKLTNMTLGIFSKQNRIKDTQSGFRAYNQDAIETLATDSTLGDGMSASLDILYHAHDHGYTIEEVGVDISYNVENPNNQNPVRHGFLLISNILQTIEHKHPILILGLPGFLSCIAGIAVSVWAISTYIRTGVYTMIPSIVASLLILAGIFSCFTAIILHALNTTYNK